MANYDFNNLLSPIDFEHLVRDVLSEDLNIELQEFSEGRDGGVDLRIAKSKNNKIVVQCKRTKELTKKTIDEEFVKIEKLNPTKYYFVCSCTISSNLQNYIKDKFNKWMNDDDRFIYSKSRLNSLLDKYKNVEKNNYKLWLHSSNIFKQIINQHLYNRSKLLIEDIKDNINLYVKNKSLTNSIEILKHNSVVIISGIPGIGKTTLAKLILWEFLINDYEIVHLKNIDEFEKLYNYDDSKQIFYFDDFLGENFLKYDVLEGKSNNIIEIINRIKSDNNKKLVLTTREYILNQAKDSYEKLNNDKIELSKHILDLNSYTKKIRAQILYNHLYYSKIGKEYIEEIIKNKTYKRIIEHKNYSPRIIEQLTINLNNVEPKDYSKTFIESLDKPFKIWDRAFNSQISDGSKLILYLLLSFSQSILLSDLNIVLESLNNTLKINFDEKGLKTYLKELEDSFIKTNLTQRKNFIIDFLNPSIKDFMLEIVKNDDKVLKFLLKNIKFIEQFQYVTRYLILDLSKNEKFKKIVSKIILNNFEILISNKIILSNNYEYSITTTTLRKLEKLIFLEGKLNDSKVTEFFVSSLKSIDFERLESSQRDIYLDIFEYLSEPFEINKTKILEILYNDQRSIQDFKNLVRFSNSISPNGKYIIEKLSEKLKETIYNEIENSENTYDLDNIKDDLKESELLKKFSITFFEFEDIYEKKSLILEEKEKSKRDGDEDLKIENENYENYDEDFDEDSLFQIGNFS